MPEDARRSRKLAAAVTILAILPVILPFPLWGLESLWIGPLDAAAWESCRAFYCPAAAHWETLATYLILGPSMLLAAASFLLGFIGLERSLRHPTSSGNRLLFWVSFYLGLVWLFIFGGILLFFLSIAGGTL
jgi:hypothetical protein